MSICYAPMQIAAFKKQANSRANFTNNTIAALCFFCCSTNFSRAGNLNLSG